MNITVVTFVTELLIGEIQPPYIPALNEAFLRPLGGAYHFWSFFVTSAYTSLWKYLQNLVNIKRQKAVYINDQPALYNGFDMNVGTALLDHRL